jgi:hypothetical protein
MKYYLNINKNVFKTITTLFVPFFISFISMKDLENDEINFKHAIDAI